MSSVAAGGDVQDEKPKESPLSDFDSGRGSQSLVVINKEDLDAGNQVFMSKTSFIFFLYRTSLFYMYL